MQGDAEPLGDDEHQLAAADRPVAGSVVVDEGEDLRGDLARSARPAALGNERLESTLVEGPVGAHAGWHRSAEAFGGLAQGRCSGTADHLVADLEEVSRIEEPVAGEEGIADLFRVWIEGSRLLEALCLWVLSCPLFLYDQIIVRY